MKATLSVLLMKCCSLLSFKALKNIGNLMGDLYWLADGRMVSITKINIEQCFPGLDKSEINKLAKKSIKETFITFLQMGPVWLRPINELLTTINKVEGIEVLNKAHNESEGVIIIAPHIGNWEILGLYLDKCGLGPKSVLYLEPKNKKIHEFIYNARKRGGSKIVPTNTRGVATILKGLKAGEMVGILPDQVPPLGAGEYSVFFGQQAYSMTLISKLLMKTKAKAVFACAIRQSNNQQESFKIIFKQANEGVYAKHIHESLKEINKGVEELVRQYPEQYQWEYKRFKRIPMDNQNIY